MDNLFISKSSIAKSKILVSKILVRYFQFFLMHQDYQNRNLFDQDFQKPVFVRTNTDAYAKRKIDEHEKNNNSILNNNELETLKINWLTISQDEYRLKDVSLLSKIHITGRAQFVATGCVFTSLNGKTPALEIFANSSAVFDKCVFKNCNGVSVIVRDRSMAQFNNCTFLSNKDSIFSFDRSYIECNNCVFSQSTHSSITVDKSASAKISDSKFKESQGKAISVKAGSKIHVYDSLFDSNKDGSIVLIEKSFGCFSRNTFQKIVATAICATKESHVYSKFNTFEEIAGNAIAFVNSTGFSYNDKIKGTKAPAIAVKGKMANPVISNTVISYTNNYAVACREASCPTFDQCTFEKIGSNVFSISEGSYPKIKNSLFKNIDLVENVIFSVFEYARPILINNEIHINNNKISQTIPPLVSSFYGGNPQIHENNGFSKLQINTRNDGTFNYVCEDYSSADEFENLYETCHVQDFYSDLEPFKPPMVNGQKLRFYTPPNDREVPRLPDFETPSDICLPLKTYQFT
ncbi:hypothetical protein TRFO_35822 [Tritrichomonas foetus]|uniref:Right handed beta helix domain-containing protein n=1 Tax=Tritrichomonas foetus TaxID=1144522 RepID=A0A1J4JFA1_9EUKA|nr:hypothetical protein TRFO_35822 [Tritrichomonas foetus]|eukprot:OHS97886.1 hypothetical protein TRFO_35822 [Tritrichomonas foetus]